MDNPNLRRDLAQAQYAELLRKAEAYRLAKAVTVGRTGLSARLLVALAEFLTDCGLKLKARYEPVVRGVSSETTQQSSSAR